MASPESRIILASGSAVRRSLLQGAGVDFSVDPPDLDEAAIIKELRAREYSIKHIALELSERKAQAVAAKHRDALVIGCDQVLEFEGQVMTKAATPAAAKENLRRLRGKTHTLISAVSVVQGKATLWQHQDEAQLSMHEFDDDFLEAYAHRAKDALTRAVGAYEIEGPGAWLMADMRGDYFTVLGLPLFALLTYLRDYHGCRP